VRSGRSESQPVWPLVENDRGRLEAETRARMDVAPSVAAGRTTTPPGRAAPLRSPPERAASPKESSSPPYQGSWHPDPTDPSQKLLQAVPALISSLLLTSSDPAPTPLNKCVSGPHSCIPGLASPLLNSAATGCPVPLGMVPTTIDHAEPSGHSTPSLKPDHTAMGLEKLGGRIQPSFPYTAMTAHGPPPKPAGSHRRGLTKSL